MIAFLIFIAWLLLNALIVCRRLMAAEMREDRKDGEHDSAGIID